MKTTEKKDYLSPEVIISTFIFDKGIAASDGMTLIIDCAEEEQW